MSFKKKSTYIKQECEYQSEDGELYEIAFIKHGDRNYVQWRLVRDSSQESEDPFVVIDGSMLEGLYSLYNEMYSAPKPVYTGIRKPKITDHRKSSQNEHLQQDGQVEQASLGLMDTPEEWSLNNVDETWKKDAVNRKTMSKAEYAHKSSSGLNFKRVRASDLI